MNYLNTLAKVCASVCFLISGTIAHAQTDFPSKVIRLIVPFPPGGPADTMARPLAAELAKKLGQPVIVENKPGANATIGTQYVARAPADGYTLLLGPDAALSLAPNIQPNIGYDAERDFVMISLLGVADQVLVVNADSSIRSVEDLKRAAQAQPNGLAYASFGIGSLSHLSMETLARKMNVKMNHIPYKGAGPSVTALLGGQVQVMLSAIAAPLPQIEAGKLRAIGYAGPDRSPLLPKVPTIAEQGYPGFLSRGWFGVLAPAATPPAVVAKLRTAIDSITQNPSFQQQFIVGIGFDVSKLGPTELSGFVASEVARSKALIDPIRGQLK